MEKVKKEEFIADLEGVLAGTLNVLEFQKKYLLGPDAVEIEGITDGAAPNLAGHLGHLVADDDPRDTEEYKRMQKSELKKLIQLVKDGAPASELDKIHFLGDSDLPPPGIAARIFMYVALVLALGVVTLILKLVY